MVKELKTVFQGRATSYWLNAQADAVLAQEILDYLTDPLTASSDKNRFDQLLKLSQESNEPEFFLACCAYTLWEVNGRMDYQVARLYALLSGFTKHLLSTHYSHTPSTPVPLITSWLLPVLKNQHGLRRFLQAHEVFLRGSTPVFIQAITVIQKSNITHNLETIASASTLSSDKAKQLQQYSKLSSHPQTFLQAAQQTQHAAIFWDKLFIKLLKL